MNKRNKYVTAITFTLIFTILIPFISYASTAQNTSDIYLYNNSLELAYYNSISWNTYEDLINSILEVPSKPGYINPIPKDVTLLNVKIKKDILEINLSKEFNEETLYNPGMFLDMFAKDFESVKEIKGVLFLSDGRKIDYVGEYVFNAPFYFASPNDESIKEKNSNNNIPSVVVAPDLNLVIDPGHAGVQYIGAPIDSGAYNWEVTNSIKEKDATLDIALKLRNYAGLATSVTLTRTGDDASLTNAERTRRINTSGGNCLVSLHNNSQGGTDANGNPIQLHSAQGISTLYYDSSDQLFASDIHSKAKDAYFGTTYGKFQDRSISYQNLYVLRDTTVPGCLIESGFISNTTHDYRIIENASYRNEIAYRIWLGIRYSWWRY